MHNPHPSARRGLTLLEILVTMVVSGVVLIGIGTLFMGATSDYAELARQREERYSRELLESELLWRLKQVPGNFLPTAATQDLAIINFPTPDLNGTTQGEFLAYDYLRNDIRTAVGLVPAVPAPDNQPTTLLNSGPCGTLVIPAGVGVRTGLIFQWYTVVYVIERDITGDGAQSFRSMGPGAVQALVNATFTGAPPGGIIGPTPIGIGIQRLDFQIRPRVNPPPPDPPLPCNESHLRRVEWSISQFI